MYAIQAQIEYQTRDKRGRVWTGTRQIPTFYLDENVQGFLSEAGAIDVARLILGTGPNEVPHIVAVKID